MNIYIKQYLNGIITKFNGKRVIIESPNKNKHFL